MPLKYFAYGFGAMKPMIFLKQSEFLEKIKDWGFVVNPLIENINGINEIEALHRKIDNLRSSLDYDIDGLVYKVNDIRLQKDSVTLQTHQGGQQLTNFLQKKQSLGLKIL